MITALAIAACDGGGHPARSHARSVDPPSSSARSSLPSATATTSRAGGRTARDTTPPTPPIRRVGPYGRFRTVRLPASDGFHPRAALVFVPRDLRPHAGRPVQVLELLHGTPGQPSDWLTRGDLLRTAEDFAARHGGRVPLVVLPDLNGSQHADSECIRTAAGADVESYLTRDVVRYVRTKYAAAVGTAKWWIAGLSEGGICAAVLALRHPGTYSAFGDFSGLARPTVEHRSPAASDEQLYGGSTRARAEHDPIWLLGHRHYRGMSAWFICGLADTKVRAAQAQVVAAARRAGLPVSAQLLPGKHVWTIWAAAVRQALPWFTRHAVV